MHVDWYNHCVTDKYYRKIFNLLKTRQIARNFFTNELQFLQYNGCEWPPIHYNHPGMTLAQKNKDVMSDLPHRKLGRSVPGSGRRDSPNLLYLHGERRQLLSR